MPVKSPYSISVNRLCALWLRCGGSPLWQKARTSLRNYIADLGYAEVEEAVIVALGRCSNSLDAYRYFCGICRSKLREQSDDGELVCCLTDGLPPFLARINGEDITPIQSPTKGQLAGRLLNLIRIDHDTHPTRPVVS